MASIAIEKFLVNRFTGNGSRKIGTHLVMETELALLSKPLLHQEWGSFSNHHMVLAEDLRLAMCEFDSLYLQQQLRDAVTATHMAHGVVHRIHIRCKVLEKHQWIGIESACSQILHLRSNFLLRHLEILVL